MRRRIAGWVVVASLGAAALLRGADDPPANGAGRTSGIEKANFNPSVRPQDDLFRHVNGAWLSRTEIPPERPLYGSFVELADRAEADLRAIIEAAAASRDRPAGSESQKIGDLYADYLDEARAERLGVEPIAPELARVEAIRDKADLVRVMAALQRDGVDGLFGGHVSPDAKRSDRYILYLSQSGLGLPDESYYRDPKFQPIRDAYRAHVATTFRLCGLADPEAAADRVLAIETELARHHWDRVRSRDRTLTYNRKDRKGLDELAPGFDWGAWFAGLGAGEIAEVVVSQPSYFTAAGRALDEVPLDRWKDWLRWSLIRENAPRLNKALVEENFAFYGRTLTGVKEMRPRWKRAVSAVERALGEAVGKVYVAEHFPPEAKARMQELVGNLVAAYRDDIQSLEWMGPETKQKALAKLARFTPKIGYPETWRDYSTLEIRRGDLVGNIRRANAFELRRNLDKLGKPVDRGEWLMTPQTVNAYYNPGMNEIVFPAAILQPPFFDPRADDAVNYGGIGAVIGHEIGHGFDDQGSKYDGEGNMNNWWTDSDRREFDRRARALIAQYNDYEPADLPGQHVNGALTIGENIGDLGGLAIAVKAYERSLRGTEAPVLDGLTGPQRLFIGWAQVWRSKYRKEELMRRLAIDPHSPTEFRCNGVVRNLPEFYVAFGVKEGDRLWLPPDRRVRIW